MYLPSVVATWGFRGAAALAATLLLFWLLRRIRLLFVKLLKRAEASLKTRGQGLAVRNVEVLSSDAIIRILTSILGAVRFVLGLGLAYAWLLAVSFTLDTSRRIFDLVTTPVIAAAETVGSALLSFLPNLAMLILIFVVARFLLRTTDILLDAVAVRRIQVDWLAPDLVQPTKRIVTFAGWFFAFVISFPYLPGSDSRAFQGISLLLGVVVSLGSSSLVANLLGGLVLTYTRAFRKGDRVKIGDVVGDVVDLGAFNTHIRTIKDEEVVVPNAIVQSGLIMNFSAFAKSSGVKVHTSVTIGYETPWRTVHRLLIDAARATDGIKANPEPYVLQKALDDFYVRYEINAHTERANDLHLVEARLCQSIQDTFFREGVEICSPHFTNLRDGSAKQIPQDPGGGS